MDIRNGRRDNQRSNRDCCKQRRENVEMGMASSCIYESSVDSLLLKILVIGIVVVFATAFPLLLPHIVQFLLQAFPRRPHSRFLLSNLVFGDDQRLRE